MEQDDGDHCTAIQLQCYSILCLKLHKAGLGMWMLQGLPSTQETQSCFPSSTQTRHGGTSSCHSKPGELEAGGPEIQDPPWLHIEFEASLRYISPCLKNKA